MTLTSRQLESLDTGMNLSVTAGAGSGKTKVLVERYLSILRGEEDVLPSNILALTFTEKASLEMRERIMREVQALSDEEGGRWIRVREDLEAADIATIHGFCTGLIRTEGLSMGIDPDFGVLNETEITSILSDIINGMFTTPGPESPALRRLIVDLGQWRVVKLLKSLIRDRAKLPHDIGSSGLKEASVLFHRKAAEEMMSSALEGLDGIMPHLERLSVMGLPHAESDSGVKLLRGLSGVLSAVREGRTRREILEALHGARSFLLTRSGSPRSVNSLGNSRVWGADHREMKDSVKAVSIFVSEHGSILPFIGNPSLLERAERRLLDVITVLEALHSRYAREKNRINSMDFDDQISLAVRMLEEDGGILRKMRRRYTHILLDEFQDTDPRQWRIAELLWNGGESCRLFMVGDPKQSIYGFRSADVRLFLEASSMLEGHEEGKVVVLDRNFRSAFEIMEFVNGIFPGLMGTDRNRWSVPFDPLDAHRGPGGSVTVVSVIGSRRSEEREGRKAADLIMRAMREWKVMDEDGPRDARFSDIAILVPTRTGFDRYEDALRNASIPYRVYNSGGFFRRQEVKDVLELLNFLVDQNDDIALASVLKGPFFSLSDEDLMSVSLSDGSTLWEKLGRNEAFRGSHDLLERFIDMSFRSEPCMVLAEIFSATGVHATAGGRRQYRNLDRILEWTADPRNGTSVAELRDSLARLVEDPPKEGEPQFFVEDEVVTLLTIHAAKGLEWPIVFILGLEHEGRKNESPTCIISQDDGIAMKVLDTGSGDYLRTPAYEKAARDAELKEAEEKKRVFYVACTRARDHLVLSGAIPVRRNGMEGEPKGMMKLLVDGMDLSFHDMEEGQKEIGRMVVDIVRVSGDSVEELVEEEEEEDREPLSTTPELSIQTDCGVIPAKGRGFLSPTGEEVSEILGVAIDDDRTRTPRAAGNDGPAPFELGEMVHRVLEGIPVERVVREYGYPDLAGPISMMSSDMAEQVKALGPGVGFREVEFVGYLESGGEKHPLKGRVDLLVIDDEGNALIVDYKTGKRRKEHEAQLEAYVRMIEPLAGGSVRSTVVSPGDDNNVHE
ncbi:MAG: hypothetical protein DRN57_05430 [Thermoplasmata archaeon]|nr:MAG: hypothetical protein DRN57_05430 [Thermoplasmata archaeon]